MEKLQTHNRLQQDCFTYCWNKYPQTRYCMFHVTNELAIMPAETKKQHIIRLSKAKAIGVVPGVLDLIFYFRGTLHAFDIKVGKDKLSDSQKAFIAAIEAQGGKCYVINSFEDFKVIVDKIVNL